MKTNLFTLLVALTLVLASCNKVVDDEPKPINLDLKSAALVKADNEFGLDLFKLVNKTEDGNNTISPLSVSLALAMTYNGAKGETQLAMEEALRLNGLTPDEINQSYKSMVAALLEADPKVTLGVAQSIWYREGFEVLDEFKNINKTYYNAEVAELDFFKPTAKDVMNSWIEENTNNKIKDMIKEVNPDHVMFLINAIYFNGQWKCEFKKSETQNLPFHVSPTKTINIATMQKEDSVNYMSNDLFAAIEMPYGSGNFNMVVLLPNDGKTCDDIIGEMNAKTWDSWMSSFSGVKNINIRLPKFKDEYEIKLNDALKAMGMELAFTPNANFTGINADGGIFIDYVQHNTFIDVNEKGTEAAAATVVAIKEFMASLPSTFHVDRPFVYAITEKQTGAILFIGKIVEPTY